jgi:hypothetical protein
MFEWFSVQSKEVQVNIIGSIVTIVTIILTIIVKDIIISKIKERTKEQNIQLKTYKAYSFPIIKASEKLALRLGEILSKRGSFLLSKNTNNIFYVYKYNSTIYRLCVLMGWIKAIYAEYTFFDSSNKNEFDKIEESIKNFQSALADGQQTEILILKKVTQILGLDISKLNPGEKEKLAINLEDVLYNNLASKNALSSSELSDEEQLLLLKSISEKLCEKLNCSKLSDEIIKESKHKLIREISIVEAYIYRDWQNAIGEIFITKSNSGLRKYEVLGYREFDNIISNKNDNYKWIEKVEKLFININIEIDDSYDSRVKQIKKIYSSCIDLIDAFLPVTKNKNIIPIETLVKLKNYRDKLKLGSI